MNTHLQSRAYLKNFTTNVALDQMSEKKSLKLERM